MDDIDACYDENICEHYGGYPDVEVAEDEPAQA
jgi:hypothetical protein